MHGAARLLIRIASADQVHGILVVESARSNFLFEEHLLRIFASRCAAALKRVELARGRSRVEEALIRVGATITAAQVSRMVVHEVKNTLSSIFWTLRAVRRLAAESRTPEKLNKKLDVVDTEIARLRNLTARLREFSSGSLVPKKSRVFLNDIVRRTVEVLDSSIERRGVKYELDLDPGLDRSVESGHAKMLFVDQAQMSQVIINLTLNALEASGRDGKIQFSTRLHGQEAWFEVADTGKGLQPAQVRRLFDPEFSTKHGGGLGLVISKLLVEDNHHGRIAVNSRAGQGTRISIALPLPREGGH
jgi:signal transduction histidine kinase